MVTPSHNQDATIHPGKLRAPKPSSFLEGLRRDRDRRYPISQAEKGIEQQAFRVCMGIASLLPGSEIPELLFARDAYRCAARSGDAPGMQSARVAALSSCLHVGLSMAGTPIGEICPSWSGVKPILVRGYSPSSSWSGVLILFHPGPGLLPSWSGVTNVHSSFIEDMKLCSTERSYVLGYLLDA